LAVYSLFGPAARAASAPDLPSRSDIFSMIDARQFGKLEVVTKGLRDERIGFYNGWPPMYEFYRRLAFETPDEGVWNRYIDSFSEWQSEYPQSPTPRIALANLFKDYAWMARGSGWSDSVTPEGWRLFGERLKKAQDILSKAEALPVQDAEAYYAQIIVARGLGLPKGDVEDAFRRGLAVNPEYLPIYSARAVYLLPKWYGEKGAWERFASESGDKRGGDDGDVLYMFVVRSVAGEKGSELFKDPLVSYPRMKKGFLVSRSRYPQNTYELNSFCYFASISGDTEAASRMFDEIGGDYDESVWGSQKVFDYWRSRAKSDGPVASPTAARAAAPAVAPVSGARRYIELAGAALIVVLLVLVAYLARRVSSTAPPQPPVL
jgi:hypothetical protein